MIGIIIPDTRLFDKFQEKYGCQEIVVEGPEGWISETSGSCLLMINKKNELATPAAKTLPLPGITLQTVKSLAEKIGDEVKEVFLKYKDLKSIIGIALSGTWSEVTQVTGIKVGMSPKEETIFFFGQETPLLGRVRTDIQKDGERFKDSRVCLGIGMVLRKKAKFCLLI